MEDASALDLDRFRRDGALERPVLVDQYGIGEDARGDFPIDLGGADVKGTDELGVGLPVDDQMARLDGPDHPPPCPDVGGGRADEVPVQLADDEGGGAGHLWARQFARLGDGERPVGLDALAEIAIDFEVAEIEVMPALDATAAARQGADLLRGRAIEAIDLPHLLAVQHAVEPVHEARPFGLRGSGGFCPAPEVDMLAAFTAKGASDVLGLLLRRAARRTGNCDFIRQALRHQRREDTPGLTDRRHHFGLLVGRPGRFRLHLSDFIGGDLGFTDEGGAFFDDQAGGLEIAVQLGVGL